MWSCVNLKGYVLVRQGFFKCRKKLCHLSLNPNYYSKNHKSEIFSQEDDSTSSIVSSWSSSSKDNLSRDVSEMKLRDVLNCFYVSGWVPYHLMKECVSQFSTTDLINTEIGPILLRSCGHTLATCENKIRIDITNIVWKKFVQAMDLCHDQYHILLSVDAENCFYRNEVLREMQSKSLEPNQTTYNLLLQSASESNNKAAFTTVKSLMEKNGASFEENFFSSLVRLHTFDKNFNEIQDIEKTFYTLERKPSDIVTYALMRAYASLGSYNSLVTLLEKSISNEQNIQSNQLAHIIAELAHCVTNDEVVQLINHIHSLELRLVIKDVNWLTAYLTSRQFERVAFEMLRKISWENLPAIHMDSPPATLVSLTCAFWNNDKEEEELWKIVNTVESEMKIPWTMETALHGALLHRNTGSAWIVLEEMHRKGRTLRSHYFWPLFLNASCPEEMLFIVKKMVEFGVPLDTITLKSFVIGRLLPRGVNPTYLGDRLVQAGVRSKLVILALDVYFLENDQMDVALQRVLRPKFEGSTELVEALTAAYLRKQDDVSTVKFLKILQSDRVTKTDWVGQVIVDVYSKNPAMGERLLKSMQSGGIKISPDVVVLIKALREQAKVDNVNRIQDMKEHDESGNWPRLFSGHYLHPKQMNAEEMENHLAELRAKGMNTRNILRKLFLIHTNKRNVKRAKEVLQELQELPNMEWSAAMLASKMQLYAMLGETDQSLDTFLEIKSKFPRFNIDFYKVMAVAEALVRDGKFTDALDILEDLPTAMESNTRDFTSFLVLLEVSSDKEISIQDLKSLIDLMISKKYVVPSNPILSFFVNYHIKRENFEEAVREFGTLSKQYHLAPNKFELLSALHSAKLNDKLNSFNKLKEDVLKVIKARSDYHLLDELLPAAQAGDKEEVLSILSRMSKERNWRSFEWQCRHWAISDNVGPLELILSAAQELKAKSLDLSQLVLALADVYYYHGEREKINQLLRTVSKGEISVVPESRRVVEQFSRTCGLLDKAECKTTKMEDSSMSAVL